MTQAAPARAKVPATGQTRGRAAPPAGHTLIQVIPGSLEAGPVHGVRRLVVAAGPEIATSGEEVMDHGCRPRPRADLVMFAMCRFSRRMMPNSRAGRVLSFSAQSFRRPAGRDLSRASERRPPGDRARRLGRRAELLPGYEPRKAW
jgi:hypothetical protein